MHGAAEHSSGVSHIASAAGAASDANAAAGREGGALEPVKGCEILSGPQLDELRDRLQAVGLIDGTGSLPFGTQSKVSVHCNTPPTSSFTRTSSRNCFAQSAMPDNGCVMFRLVVPRQADEPPPPPASASQALGAGQTPAAASGGGGSGGGPATQGQASPPGQAARNRALAANTISGSGDALGQMQQLLSNPQQRVDETQQLRMEAVAAPVAAAAAAAAQNVARQTGAKRQQTMGIDSVNEQILAVARENLAHKSGVVALDNAIVRGYLVGWLADMLPC